MRRTIPITATVLVFLFLCAGLPQLLSAAGKDAPAAGDEEDYEDEYCEEEPAATIADPLEPFNQDMYALNDFLVLYVLEPAAKVEKAIVPWEFRTILRNMGNNIRFPVRFVNCLLQGKWEKGGDEFAAFFVNTTAGFLGMADVAAAYPGLLRSPEDMGQTFAVWGWTESAYLALPFFGPSSFRDTLGKLPDAVLDPLFWLVKSPQSIGLRAGEAVNDTSFQIGDYEALKKAALDPYVAIRNGYVQNRNKKIAE
jgi:phospholipid-binding lipoprotein MlaA